MKRDILQSELKKRNLPNLFQMPDGQVIQTKEEWENKARLYWREVLLKEEYGQVPSLITPKIALETKAIDFAGKAKWETVSFTFEKNGNTHVIPTQLIFPKNKTNIPFFIYINFRKDIPDRYLPVEEIIDNGFGIFTVCYEDITTDNADFSNGLAGLFQQGERQGSDAGKIVYWSYMLSRMMDYLLTRSEVDKDRISVAGHSRLGKTSLLTGALDERFAFVCSNNSGCSGVALARSRSEGAESIRDICRQFSYWFCPNYTKYIDKENAMPFDQHCLLSLVAPRKACVGTAIEDIWCDNLNQFLNCVESSKAWLLYGKKGLKAPNRLPICGDEFLEGDVYFHLRKGTHYHSRTDWLIYMKAIKEQV
ncbi:MAG: hypothetical protein IJ996_03070 [Clostridia bacterium]|nr:hypothetical protein [Clostridia bacterium]